MPGRWVAIPAGTFTMGSPESEPCRYDDEDQHQVTLTRGFEIQTTEVTQEQFQAVMGYNPSTFGPNGFGPSCGSDCPVEKVSWHEAVAYCNELSAFSGLSQCYQCSGAGKQSSCKVAAAFAGQKIYGCPGYRLPTEAEWEYAYRAGTTTAYYNGPNYPDHCACDDVNADKIGWYGCNAGGKTRPVGQKQPSVWGLYDMAGNVYELCHDSWQLKLGHAAVTDPVVHSPAGSPVLRGGSFIFYFAGYLRAAHRRSGWNGLVPAFVTGFRCVRTLTP